MQYITLIPGLVCVFVLFRAGTRKAFLNVFLPVLLLFPTNFFLKITHFPDLTFVDLTLLVLGVGIFATDLRRWKLSRMDLYVVVFIFSCGYSEWVHYAAWRAGALAAMEGLVPYMLGKLMLDRPRAVIEAMQRFVTLVAVALIVGMVEFVFKKNPYTYFWSHFYPGQWGGATTQIRWGFGRVAGPYTQSEMAGIIVMAALLFGLWLARWTANVTEFGTADRGPLRRARSVVIVLAVALYTTQARGPWIGAMIALIVASIGRARRPVRRAMIVLIAGVVIGIPAYQFGKDYLSGPRTDYGSEKETAQYRAELIDNYIPLAESGGPWGLGRMVPIVHGQLSIDNEYLFLWLVQGYVGLTTFLLIMTESIGTIIWYGLKTRYVRDRELLFTLLGVLMGLAFIVTTVWLGAQSFELFFLLAGWSQVIQSNVTEDTGDHDTGNRERSVRPLRQEAQTITVYT